MKRKDNCKTPEDSDDYSEDEEDSDEYDGDANDDSSCYDRLEEDKGDRDDGSVEMGACGFDDYGTWSDAASPREADVLEPFINPSASLRPGKGRTATKVLKVSKPMYLEFDNLDRPKGKWRLKYGQHVGFCLRKLNINWIWKDVSEETKKIMWEDTMKLFHIPDEKRFRKKFLSLVAKRFRDFKSKLVSGWITKTRIRSKFEDGREPPEIWKHIKIKDWRLFQQIKTSSPAKNKRDKAVASAKKNDHYHHLGQNDFNTARQIWMKDGLYPGKTLTLPATQNESTSSMTVDINRGDDWFCAMHSKDKETGQYVINKPSTKEVADKYIELRDKQVRGEFISEQYKDALYYALGEKEDYLRRARGFGGVNINVKQAFGFPTDRNGRSRKKGASTEDREALKNELREELRNELKLELRSSMSSVLQEMGLPGLTLPEF